MPAQSPTTKEEENVEKHFAGLLGLTLKNAEGKVSSNSYRFKAQTNTHTHSHTRREKTETFLADGFHILMQRINHNQDNTISDAVPSLYLRHHMITSYMSLITFRTLADPVQKNNVVYLWSTEGKRGGWDDREEEQRRFVYSLSKVK